MAVKTFIILASFIFFAFGHTDDLNALLRLISDWTPKDPSWTSQTPVCQWRGVNCSSSGVVTDLQWNSMQIYGTFNGTNLPSNVQTVFVGNNQLWQIPILSGLPASLQNLYLGANQFRGTPNLSGLPAGLLNLDLHLNQFTGFPVLSSLPAGLQILSIGNNQFTGTPALNSLPASLQYLDLSYNQFCGSTILGMSCQQVNVYPATCNVLPPNNNNWVTFTLPC